MRKQAYHTFINAILSSQVGNHKCELQIYIIEVIDYPIKTLDYPITIEPI